MRKTIAGVLLALFCVVIAGSVGCANKQDPSDSNASPITRSGSEKSVDPTRSGEGSGTRVSAEDSDFTPWVKSAK